MKIAIRSIIIFVWVTLIAGILYFPKWEVIEENGINIFAWGDVLDPRVISAFEQETGIKVHLNYYSSNEELLVKMKATKGFGYDLIVPSDYAVRILIGEDLLKEIDRSKLDFWPQINPLLLNLTFDPGNRFSIPFEWEIFGFGIDRDYFQKSPDSWKYVFSPENYRIVMINDPIESVLLASFYLHGSIPHLDPPQLNEVKNLLLNQKKWVEAYADFRGDYFLATKNCPVVVASSSYIFRSMAKFPFIKFVTPKEGTYISLESLSIPKTSQKEELVYKLINHLFRPESVKKHFQTYAFFPASYQPEHYLQMHPDADRIYRASEKEFAKLHLFRNIVSEAEARNVWIEIKSGLR